METSLSSSSLATMSVSMFLMWTDDVLYLIDREDVRSFARESDTTSFLIVELVTTMDLYTSVTSNFISALDSFRATLHFTCLESTWPIFRDVRHHRCFVQLNPPFRDQNVSSTGHFVANPATKFTKNERGIRPKCKKTRKYNSVA